MAEPAPATGITLAPQIRVSRTASTVGALTMAMTLPGCAALTAVVPPGTPESSERRDRAIARAQVWQPTDIPSMNLKAGPQEHPGAFPFGATVRCEYSPEELGGASPKFACVQPPDDELKVKYGVENAEVYGEVAASRVLWALGFGADRMYPLRVVCRGCPPDLGGVPQTDDAYVFDPVAIERDMPGREFPGEEDWAWPELAMVDEESGGAPRAHVDALKLIAVFIQHTDTKAENQRLICLEGTPSGGEDAPCERPFMLMQDLGLTFGAAHTFNRNDTGMNLAEWSETPVWKDETGCVGNLSRSLTGTLGNPEIGEEGRRFLADLLMQLSDAQIRDLFEAARVELRRRNPRDEDSPRSTVEEWVRHFKQKRGQIVDRRCPS